MSRAVPDGFVRATRLDDVADGALTACDVGPSRVCLARVGDDVSALGDACPHAAFPLSDGELLDDDTIQCAMHGARFDRHTGAVRQGPATAPAASYDVLLHDGHVYVRPRR